MKATGFSVFGALYVTTLGVLVLMNSGNLYPTSLPIVWQVLGMLFCVSACAAVGFAAGNACTLKIGDQPAPSQLASWGRFLATMAALTFIAYKLYELMLAS